MHISFQREIKVTYDGKTSARVNGSESSVDGIENRRVDWLAKLSVVRADYGIVGNLNAFYTVNRERRNKPWKAFVQMCARKIEVFNVSMDFLHRVAFDVFELIERFTHCIVLAGRLIETVTNHRARSR